MLAVGCVYLGFATGLLGVVVLLHPLPAIGLPTRVHGLALGVLAMLLIGAGVALPTPETRVATPRTALDRFAPRYQFGEYHAIRVQAPPAVAYQAIQAVTADEIRFFHALTWIRRLGRPGPENILNAPGQRPLLEVATRTSFLPLAEEPGREAVIGTVVVAPKRRRGSWPRTPAEFTAFAGPGTAVAAMNFRVEPDGRGGSLVTTETRVFATDARTRRRFAAYWRVIYPGSALIRVSWLQAIRDRAERAERAERAARTPP